MSDWHNNNFIHQHGVLWIVGAVIGVGQLLLGDAPLSWRRILGRALVSGGLGVAFSTAYIFWPDADPRAMLGGAAMLASLGTSGIERIIDAFLRRK